MGTLIGGYRLTRDLQYWWDLDAGGATVTDQKNGLVLTRERVGSSSGTTSGTAAPDGGGCIQFDTAGSDQCRFINSSVAKLASYDTGFTTNIWIRRTSDGAATGHWLISHRSVAPSTSLYFQHARSNISGNASSVIFNNTGAFFAAQAASPGLNTWYMHTLVFRAGVVELWINAVKVDTQAFSGTIATGAAPYAIGGPAWVGSISGSSLAVRGQLWCAGHWNRPLNGAEIAALYNNGTGRKYAQL